MRLPISVNFERAVMATVKTPSSEETVALDEFSERKTKENLLK